jgi:DNA-binding XRE family transcriptional regulator
MSRRRVPAEDRFYQYIRPAGAYQKIGDVCWLWIGSLNRNGYGQFWNGHRVVLAHRFAYELVYGEHPPSGLDLCHTCDVRNCVNTRHLLPGTRRDNLRDMSRKGRAGRAKLDFVHAQSIRSSLDCGVTQTELARFYGVSQATISQIKQGKIWRDIPYFERFEIAWLMEENRKLRIANFEALKRFLASFGQQYAAR